MGSGFFVGEYVATNGHVVAGYAEDVIIGGLVLLDPQLEDFLVAFIQEVLNKEANIQVGASTASSIGYMVLTNPAAFNSFAQDLYKYMDNGYIGVEKIADHHYVNLGRESITLKDEPLTHENIDSFITLSENIREADLKAFDLANFFSKESIMGEEKPKESDVALLKLKDSSNLTLPSLPLATGNVHEGENILILGFPGLVSGMNESALLLNYDDASTKATVTKGIISSIKEDHNGRNLIQTDASIEHGNSGGPAFNADAERNWYCYIWNSKYQW